MTSVRMQEDHRETEAGRGDQRPYCAKLTGPYRRQLRAHILAEISDAQEYAQCLADKAALTMEPRQVPHADQPREMLVHALRTEKQAIEETLVPDARAGVTPSQMVDRKLLAALGGGETFSIYGPKCLRPMCERRLR
jgi:hypothetical protein